MTGNFGKTLFQRNQNEQEKCPSGAYGFCEHEVDLATDLGLCPTDEYLKACIARVLVHFNPGCIGCICQVLEHNYLYNFCIEGCDCYIELSFENKTETRPYN